VVDRGHPVGCEAVGDELAAHPRRRRDDVRGVRSGQGEAGGVEGAAPGREGVGDLAEREVVHRHDERAVTGGGDGEAGCVHHVGCDPGPEPLPTVPGDVGQPTPGERDHLDPHARQRGGELLDVAADAAGDRASQLARVQGDAQRWRHRSARTRS
jgi:hypothetical protein